MTCFRNRYASHKYSCTSILIKRIESIYFMKLSLTCFVCDQGGSRGTYSQHMNCKHFISFIEQGMQLSKSGLIVNAIQKKVLVLKIEIAICQNFLRSCDFQICRNSLQMSQEHGNKGDGNKKRRVEA